MTRLSFYLRREWLGLILAAVLGALALNCFYGPLAPRDLLVLRQHRSRLTVTRDQLLAENAQLKTRVDRLRSDDAYVQSMIRQELGYARPYEFVYRFSDHKSAASR
jgi:cell division protein FtsB